MSSFLLDYFVYSCQKGGEYTLECIPESFVISIWLLCTSLRGEILFLMHICRERDIPYGRCIYQGEEDIVLKRKLCFGVWCMIKLLTCFTSCLLDRNLFVTLYLSFYYLLYLEGLMCLVQVFQVIGIYVSSASQEEMCAHWKGKCLYLYPCLCSYCVLYPCCFCKLLGLFSCICRLLWFVPHLCSLYALFPCTSS